MRRYLVICLLILFMPLQALAVEALVGHYEDHTGAAVKVSVLKDGKARIDIGSEVYFLCDGDNVNVVSAYMDDKWTKADFVALTTDAISDNPSILQKYSRVGVIDTGYTTEVAGYTGKTFEITVSGTGEVYTINLVEDPDVAKLSKVIMILFRDWTLPPGSRDVVEIINDKLKTGYGMLSIDREIALKKVSREEYDAAYFELPATLRD